MTEKDDIKNAADKLPPQEFASALACYLQFTNEQILAFFPTVDDRRELSLLMDILLNSADEQEKRQRLVQDVANIIGAIVKLIEARI